MSPFQMIVAVPDGFVRGLMPLKAANHS